MHTYAHAQFNFGPSKPEQFYSVYFEIWHSSFYSHISIKQQLVEIVTEVSAAANHM